MDARLSRLLWRLVGITVAVGFVCTWSQLPAEMQPRSAEFSVRLLLLGSGLWTILLLSLPLDATRSRPAPEYVSLAIAVRVASFRYHTVFVYGSVAIGVLVAHNYGVAALASCVIKPVALHVLGLTFLIHTLSLTRPLEVQDLSLAQRLQIFTSHL